MSMALAWQKNQQRTAEVKYCHNSKPERWNGIVMFKVRRSQTAFIWLLHLPGTAQEGRGQIDLAPPPHLRGSLLHGDWEVEQPCFLVGNNQLSSPTPYTLYYYLPELVMTRAGNATRQMWKNMKSPSLWVQFMAFCCKKFFFWHLCCFSQNWFVAIYTLWCGESFSQK